MARPLLFRACIALMFLALATATQASPQIDVRRIPAGGVQPQAVVDSKGGIHLIYLTGDPSHSDIQYVRSGNGGATWSKPIRVNSQPGNALAIGSVRGAQMAIGRDSSVYVAWMGSDAAEPKAPHRLAPMLFARLSNDGTSFTPQQNLITAHPGLDGGGSIAADEQGNVFVAWHAPAELNGPEQDRRVWVARSMDDGKTFAPEVAISDPSAGACGCCGMRVFVQGKTLFALYRGAAQMTDRGMRLIDASLDLRRAQDRQIDPMNIGTCIMSRSNFAGSSKDALMAWETKGQVYWARAGEGAIHPHPAPGTATNRKHPALACDRDGNALLTWTEGTSWNKGGSVAWQLYDPTGRPIAEASGHRVDLPTWDLPAAICSPSGSWVVLY